MPMGPTMDGIVYTNEPALLTNTVSLGTFTNTGINNTNSFFTGIVAFRHRRKRRRRSWTLLDRN